MNSLTQTDNAHVPKRCNKDKPDDAEQGFRRGYWSVEVTVNVVRNGPATGKAVSDFGNFQLLEKSVAHSENDKTEERLGMHSVSCADFDAPQRDLGRQLAPMRKGATGRATGVIYFAGVTQIGPPATKAVKNPPTDITVEGVGMRALRQNLADDGTPNFGGGDDGPDIAYWLR